MAVEQTLAEFRETEGGGAFSLQNSKLLKVELADVTIQAKLGSMVAYQGDVRFEHAGSGGMSRMIKKAVTSEGTDLMKVSGSGEVFLAEMAQDVHVLELEDDFVTANGANVLAFDAGIDWDIKRVEGASGMLGGGLYNMELRGSGLPGAGLGRAAGAARGRRRADVRRPACRDHVVERAHDLGQDRRQPQDVHRARLGRDLPGLLLRPGLGPDPALGGPRRGRDGVRRRQLERRRRARRHPRPLAPLSGPRRLRRRAAGGRGLG